MKQKLIQTGQDILIILINHLLLIGAGMTVLGLFKQEEHYIWLWIGLTAVPLVLYFVRVKIENFFLFFALHLVIPAGIIFLPLWILPKLLVFAMIIIYMVWSINIRMKGRMKGENVLQPIFVIAALGVMALIENVYSMRGWESYYLWLAILYIAGYFVYCFTSQYLHFLAVNESSAANIPEQEIFSSGIRQSLLFVALGVIVLTLTANVEWVSYIMSWIGAALFVLLRFLFSGLGSEETEELQPYVTERVESDMGMFDTDAEPALIWIILEKIVMVAAVVFLVGLVIFAVVMGFKYLWKHFHMSTAGEVKKLQSGIDLRESCTIEKSKKESGSLFSFLNNRERIRKIYRKQVLKHREEIIGDYNIENLERMTAKECCEKMVSDGKVSVENLKKIYEKTRYSEEEITSEDVKMIKSSGRVNF